MKIIECSPFYKEGIVADIHINESLKWIDEFHVTECDYTFKKGQKGYLFNHELYPKAKVMYHKLDGKKNLKSFRKYIPNFEFPKISRSLKNWVYFNPSWRNEAAQRNNSLWNCEYSDDDILILSDIDEIIDSCHAERIISEVKKKGIVTIKIHFTNFYFNLFCKGFGGPADYSYRIFIIKGNIMRTRFKNDSDYLRKLGESGKLEDKVYCFPEFMGFHHSWLGDWRMIADKINAYAHSLEDHSDKLVKMGEELDYQQIKKYVENGLSIFPHTELIKNNDIKLLDGVVALKKDHPELFF